MRTLDFWFDFASTYTYPAALRAEAVAAQHAVALRWRPFLLGPIFQQDNGWQTSPFNLYPAKGRYMWRDLERICARLGLPFLRPAKFPQNSIHAARVAFAASAEPWLAEFVRRVLSAEFAHARDIGDPAVVADVLRELLGDDAAASHWLAAAQTDMVKSGLREQTGQARAAGIFGAPSFLVGNELFWGNDRLDEAIEFAAAAATTAG